MLATDVEVRDVYWRLVTTLKHIIGAWVHGWLSTHGTKTAAQYSFQTAKKAVAVPDQPRSPAFFIDDSVDGDLIFITAAKLTHTRKPSRRHLPEGSQKLLTGIRGRLVVCGE